MIAKINEPKAKEPKWYLKAHQNPIAIGILKWLGEFLLLKYQIAHEQATIKIIKYNKKAMFHKQEKQWNKI